MDQRGNDQPHRTTSEAGMDPDPSWEWMLEKLARTEEAEVECPLPSVLNEGAESEEAAAHPSGKAETQLRRRRSAARCPSATVWQALNLWHLSLRSRL